MRFSYIFHAFSLFIGCAFAAGNVHAQGNGDVWKHLWYPPKGEQVRPYLDEAKLPHNSQWAEDDWTPQDWVEMRGGSPLNVMDGFYRANIVTDQKFDKDTPILEVGQGFLRLSAKEQHRVMAFIDDLYNVTGSTEAGVIEICVDHEDELIGIFDHNGLQLQ